MSKAFFHAGKHSLVVARLDVDYPVGDEPRLCDRRREQVRPRDAPQDLALGAGGDACAEQRCRRTIDGAVTAASDFMQRAKRETPSR